MVAGAGFGEVSDSERRSEATSRALPAILCASKVAGSCAVGEPLTVLLQKIIESKVPADPNIAQKTNLAAMEIIKDPEATKRYEAFTGNKLTPPDSETH